MKRDPAEPRVWQTDFNSRDMSDPGAWRAVQGWPTQAGDFLRGFRDTKEGSCIMVRIMFPQQVPAMAFYIESVPNKAGNPAILLHQAWRAGKRIRKRTVADILKLPPEIVEGCRTFARNGTCGRRRHWGPAKITRRCGREARTTFSLLPDCLAAHLGGTLVEFHDDDKEAARAARSTQVEQVRPSDSTLRKAATKRTADGLPARRSTTFRAWR